MIKLKIIKDIIAFPIIHIPQTTVAVHNFISLTSYFQKNFK